jgi:hypothetical protein
MKSVAVSGAVRSTRIVKAVRPSPLMSPCTGVKLVLTISARSLPSL